MNRTKKIVLSAVLLALTVAAAAAYGFIAPKFAVPAEEEVPAEETAEELPAEETLAEPGQVNLNATDRVVIKKDNTPSRTLTADDFLKYPEPGESGIPTLYIDLERKVKPDRIQHGVYTKGSYTLIDPGRNTGIFDQPLQIKGRGNYSWSFPQKTFALNLDEAANLLDMGAAKRWVLVTTYSDKTMLRNYITLNLACKMGMQYSPEAQYVEVYFNGSYHGVYVLTEKIQLGSERVNVDPEQGGLFEIEAQYRHSDCTYCIVCPSGCHIMYKEPEEDEIGREEKLERMKKFKQIFIKADIAMTKGWDSYINYLDIDSFIDWFIVNELVKNYDSGFTTSCYCYVSEDGKIHMGPCWDYDTCMGNQNVATCLNPEGYHVAESPWYSILMADKDFKQALKERWTQLKDDGVLDWFLQLMDDSVEYLGDAEKRDHKQWRGCLASNDLRGGLSYHTYKEEVDYLKDWVTKRIAWLDKQWLIKNR